MLGTRLLTWEEFDAKFPSTLQFVEYQGLVSAMPTHWKPQLQEISDSRHEYLILNSS